MMRLATMMDATHLASLTREEFGEFIADECRRSALIWWDQSGPLDGETPRQFCRRADGDFFNIEAQATGGQADAVSSVETLRDLEAREEMRPAHEAALAAGVHGGR